jgi:hypothetical protein
MKARIDIMSSIIPLSSLQQNEKNGEIYLLTAHSLRSFETLRTLREVCFS